MDFPGLFDDTLDMTTASLTGFHRTYVERKLFAYDRAKLKGHGFTCSAIAHDIKRMTGLTIREARKAIKEDN